MPSKPFKIIPLSPPDEIIPYIDSPLMDKLLTRIMAATGKKIEAPYVTLTPKRKHVDSAISSTGNKLGLNSPFPGLKINVVTPNGTTITGELFLFIREKDRKAFVPSPVLERIHETATEDDAIEQAVTITHETRTQDQPPRKKARREKAVVGSSARNLVLKYFLDKFPELNLTADSPEIKSLNFNLCHLLGYALANQALTDAGDRFDTQIKKNIFSGSRTLNEAVFPIENSLLDFIEKNKVKAIEYIGVCKPYKEVHAVAELSLRAVLITHDGRRIEFTKDLNPRETRRVSSEVTTIVHAFLDVAMSASPSEMKPYEATASEDTESETSDDEDDQFDPSACLLNQIDESVESDNEVNPANCKATLFSDTPNTKKRLRNNDTDNDTLSLSK